MFGPKKFAQYFSILRRYDPPPTNKKPIPEFKLKPGTIIFFFYRFKNFI